MPIRLIQGFAAGGNADTIARVDAQALSTAPDQTRTFVGGQIDKWKRVVEQANIRKQ